MSTDLIIEHLDLWTSAVTYNNGKGRGNNGEPELTGIAKLRELILELAVLGKLVPQDPEDEPASNLLERVEEEKALLYKEGEIKKPKKLPEIAEEEKPFDLPKGWQWVRLGELMQMFNGRAFKSSEWSAEGLPIVRIQNLNNPNATWNYFNGELEERHRIQTGDFLISWSGTPGTSFGAFIWSRGEAALNQHINKCIFYGSDINKHYMEIAVNGKMSHFIENSQGGVGLKHLTKGTLESAVIGIPPQLEQQRIVEKVDELMALCDRLEQQTSDQISAHETLVDTLLDTLTRSQDAAELAENWARLAEHFDTLFTTEYSIDRLEQTILQLAVMGRLVPQDPNDEPASVLLERIAAEKKRLIEKGTVRKAKNSDRHSGEDGFFTVKEGWEWRPLEDLFAVVTDGDHQAPPKTESGVPFLTIGNLNSGFVDFSGSRHVPEEYYDSIDWSRKPNARDILYTVTGSYGIPVKVLSEKPFCVQRHVAILKSVSDTPVEYINLFLKSAFSFDYATKISTGIAQKTVPLSGLRMMPIAVPPEQEMERILKIADELMALCHRLKSRLIEAGEIQNNLADSIVKQAVD